MKEGVTMFGPDNIFLILGLLPFIFYLFLIVFGSYFVIKIIKFMKVKIELDSERNSRIDELIKVFKDSNHIK